MAIAKSRNQENSKFIPSLNKILPNISKKIKLFLSRKTLPVFVDPVMSMPNHRRPPMFLSFSHYLKPSLPVFEIACLKLSLGNAVSSDFSLLLCSFSF